MATTETPTATPTSTRTVAATGAKPGEGTPILEGHAGTAAAGRLTHLPVHFRGGFILWFTGLSGAGKSTLARAVTPVIREERPVEVLDGDEVRTYLSKGLGFSKEDRDANIQRIGFVARLLARNGAAAITAAISPYAEIRDEVRELAEKDGVPFVEVYVEAKLESLVARDTKGLYKKALAGELAHFTGVSDPYEPPSDPELVIRSDQETIEQSAARVLSVLAEWGLVNPAAKREAVA
jgi:adenylyl-sulfate kinase